MLQMTFLRQYRDLVIEKLTVKHFSDPGIVDTILQLDEQRRKILTDKEELLAGRNAASKAIGLLMSKGLKEEVEAQKLLVAQQKIKIDELELLLSAAEKDQQDLLIKLPNLPSDVVPLGKTPEENVVERSGGTMPTLPANAVPHWDLIKQYHLVDFETGVKLTGSGFPLYKGKGAKLQRALIQYFLDFNTAAGYTEYLPPFMVNEASAWGTGQLPDKEGQMYFMPADNYYLIPTAEVPVTNIYRDEIVKESELPIKMTAYTPCFRREAGSFGKDVRGLNRVHQFDKIEIVQLVHPEKSYETLDAMVAHVEKLVQSLGLPYRILRLCGGDMSFSSALTYDFEVYSMAQERWLEVSSVSNFETFQSNRMKIRFKDGNGKMQLVHTLNGSSLALPRILASILENYQQEDHIKIPEVLWEYFKEKEIR
jgi:seryl-tRNA synthetase